MSTGTTETGYNAAPSGRNKIVPTGPLKLPTNDSEQSHGASKPEIVGKLKRKRTDRDQIAEEKDHRNASSVTYTIRYENLEPFEPFESFQHKVFDLLKKEYRTLKSTAFTVERMHDGQNNRIIGITVDFSKVRKLRASRLFHRFFCMGEKAKGTKKYVIRTPGSGPAELGHEIAAQSFAYDQSSLRIPRIGRFDLTINNPLKAVYSIQEQMPGTSLDQVWEALTLEQKKSVAAQVAIISGNLHRYTDTRFGRIGVSYLKHNGLCQPSIPVDVLPFGILTSKRNLGPAVELSTKDYLIDRCWMEEIIEKSAQRNHEAVLWRKLRDIVENIDEHGFLGDNISHFGNLGLRLGNIMVQLERDSAITITGLLGWKKAFFAPKFRVYEPPTWLWHTKFEELGDIEPNGAISFPKDQYHQEIKEQFDTIAGEEYRRYAYTPAYHLLRYIWRVLHDDLKDTTSLERHVCQIQSYWQKLKEHLKSTLTDEVNRTKGKRVGDLPAQQDGPSARLTSATHNLGVRTSASSSTYSKASNDPLAGRMPRPPSLSSLKSDFQPPQPDDTFRYYYGETQASSSSTGPSEAAPEHHIHSANQ